jgi:hypothetical protein
MDKIICQGCQLEFPDEPALHRHIRKHKLKVEQYYPFYWPRYDKFSGEPIKFRNKEQYFVTDFNSRINLQKWLDKTPKDTVRAYTRNLLITRKEKKNLVWTPSQVELRTLMVPPLRFYDEVFGNYYKLCEELGFKNRFDVDARILADSDSPNPLRILVDNREQRPLEFPSAETEWATIKFGDYACVDDSVTCGCHIERKSASDFVGTFSGGYERFCREMDRCVAANAYMVVLVEETLYNCLRFNYLPDVYAKKTRVQPEFIFRNVRDLIQKYENIQFLFVNGRQEAARIIERLFRSQCTYKMIDLQACYDWGNL